MKRQSQTVQFAARLAAEEARSNRLPVGVEEDEVDEMTDLQAEMYQEFLADLAADREFWTEEDWEAQRKFDAQVARYGSPL